MRITTRSGVTATTAPETAKSANTMQPKERKTKMTAEELEGKASEALRYLESAGFQEYAEIFNQMLVRYRAARITANNYKKALEALDGSKQ